MLGTEIFLCIAGAIIIILTVVFSEFLGTKPENTIDRELIDKTTKDIVHKEVEGQLNDVIDEKIEETEGKMDKIMNEKLLAIGSYSDNVLEDIKKNHTEVMFLYNMLGEKEETLKNTIRDIEALKTSIKQMAVVNDFAKASNARKNIKVTDSNKQTVNIKKEKAEDIKQEKSEEQKINDISYEEDNNIIKISEKNEEINNNQKILELYKKGMSNMEIAKELGLGLGEVKLVIGLFDNNKN